MTDTRDRLAEAAIPHIPFDGVNMASLRAGARDLGLSEDVAIAFFPGGGAYLAAWIHKRGDESLALWLAETMAAERLVLHGTVSVPAGSRVPVERA